MSIFISKVLNGRCILGKYFQYLRNIVTLDRDNSNLSIHNIMRIVHPILTEDTVEFNTPKQVSITPFLEHVKKMMTFADKEDLKNHPFTKHYHIDLELVIILPRCNRGFIGWNNIVFGVTMKILIYLIHYILTEIFIMRHGPYNWGWN